MSEAIISTRKLEKRFGNFQALAPLTLDIYKGEVFGYLGPNGSGKTTTIRTLLGLINPSGGTAKIFNLDSQVDKIAVHRRLAYIPGEATYWPSLTGGETLHLLAKLQGTVDNQYQKELIERFQFDPTKKVRTYSKGNRQKISLIAALSTKCELLIMDEPTSGLDPIMEQVFRECISEAKKNHQTVFLSSHILEEVEALCDRVGILRAGKLVELGSIKEMKHLSALSVTATFDHIPPKIDHIKGVSGVQIIGHELSCQIHGPIDELMLTIAKAKPKTLISKEPSLEELFLALYGESETKLA